MSDIREKPKYTSTIVLGIVLLLVGGLVYGAGGYVLANKQHVVDQVRVAEYTPTAAAKEQVKRSGMSAAGQFLFYASDPTVLEKADFNQTCSAETTDTSVLGCYIPATKRIYLYHQTDKRLDGEEEVMAAHEMLRAVWDRMPSAEQKTLIPQLESTLAANTDTRLDLKTRFSNIEATDSADKYGELYAIIGTEVPSVNSTLEASYAPYFIKRSTVTKLNEYAISYVVALESQINSFDDQLKTERPQIDATKKSIDAQIASYNSDVEAFNRRAETLGGFTSEGQFDAAGAALDSRRNHINGEIKAVNKKIDGYNARLAQLKKLLSTAVDLGRSLNTTLTPLGDVTNVA